MERHVEADVEVSMYLDAERTEMSVVVVVVVSRRKEGVFSSRGVVKVEPVPRSRPQERQKRPSLLQGAEGDAVGQDKSLQCAR